MSPTDMRPEAPCLMSRLHACTSTLTNNRLSSSVMEVNQTLFWHQVRNGKDNKESVGLRYVSDKAVIFDPLGCFSHFTFSETVDGSTIRRDFHFLFRQNVESVQIVSL